ncbi:unnamed protein product [Musa acuminata subsp. burmannicoides]
MISGFRRSLSLSGLSPNASPARRRPRDAPRHARSASLPCRSQSALSLIQDEIRSLRSGAASDLERIDRLLAALDDLLRLSGSRIPPPLPRLGRSPPRRLSPPPRRPGLLPLRRPGARAAPRGGLHRSQAA